jgi:phospholipid/cholesterol/gamma-HCH transport system substrate-binding protein
VNSTPLRDSIVGLFVLAGLLALGYLSIQLGGVSYDGPGGMMLTAEFGEIGGLTERSPVVISGVKVGQVKRIELSDDLRARVVMEVDKTLKLGSDTEAAIRTSGLLGDQFVALTPGIEEPYLESGGSIAFPTDALSIEKLIGEFVHGSDLEESK